MNANEKMDAFEAFQKMDLSSVAENLRWATDALKKMTENIRQATDALKDITELSKEVKK